MDKYLMLTDGRSPHSVKWIKELKKYFDVYVLSFNGFNEELKTILNENRLYDCSINLKTGGGNFNVLGKIPQVVKYINVLKPKYINAHYITSYGTVAVIANLLCKKKSKVILSAWGTDILVAPNRNIFYRIVTKLILKYADLITSDSKYMTQKIHDLYRKTEVLTFPFGIETLPQIELSYKNINKFFSNRALEPNYNINLVIRSFYKLWQENNERILIVAHDGSEKIKNVQLTEELGIKDNVKFVGFLSASEQEKLYAECAYYFSLPSSDSTSVSLLEAMAFGCTPIVSDIPANREWIQDNVNGFIFHKNKNLDINKIENAFVTNRQIIREKAIWSKNIFDYIKKLDKL